VCCETSSVHQRRFDRNVAARVARPDHQHALVVQHVRSLVVGGVHHVAGEMSGKLGPARIPVVSVGYDHAGVATALASGKRGVPAGPQFDQLIQAEAFGIGLQILEHLRVMRKRRVVRRHREIGVLRQPLGRDGVRRGIDSAGRLAVAPVAADLVLPFENVDRNALLTQILGRRQTGGSSAYNAIAVGAIDGAHRTWVPVRGVLAESGERKDCRWRENLSHGTPPVIGARVVPILPIVSARGTRTVHESAAAAQK